MDKKIEELIEKAERRLRQYGGLGYQSYL